MNRTNVQRTIDYLRALPTRPKLPKFHMGMWVETPSDRLARIEDLPEVFECGTTACIAGHIAVGFRSEMEAGQISTAARLFLGIDDLEADHLFYGDFRTEGQDLGHITLDQAIDELERMLAEGAAP